MEATKEVRTLTEAGLTKAQATDISQLVAMVGDDLKPYLRLCATLAIGADTPIWADYALAIVRAGR